MVGSTRSVPALILVALLLAVGASEGAPDSREVVQASEILAKIERGEPVEYDGVIIEGDLDISWLDLPTEHVERALSSVELEFLVETKPPENVKVVKSPINITSSEIRGNMNFSNAIFQEQVNFVDTNFTGDSLFSGSNFSRDASFRRASFSGGDANFVRAEFSGGYTNFALAEFSGGDAKFMGAEFSGGYADFLLAEFSGGVAQFGSSTRVGRSGNIWYSDGAAKFSGGNANFEYAHFSGGVAQFSEVEFSGGYADFTGASFSRGGAGFAGAEFSGGGAKFGEAEFSGGVADFAGAEFSGGPADFEYAEFSGGDADFIGAEFSKVGASFEGAQFSDNRNSIMNFRNASFDGNASFVDAQFTQYADFRGARFSSSLDLTHSRFDRLEIEWDSIKDHLICDETVYVALVKNFNDLSRTDDADDCYYEYRREGQRNEPFGLSKISDWIAWISYGYGVRWQHTIGLSFVMIFLFGLFFKLGSGIQKSMYPCQQISQKISWPDTFYFSALAFVSQPPYNWGPRDGSWWKYVVLAENILGWIFLTLFVITLT